MFSITSLPFALLFLCVLQCSASSVQQLPWQCTPGKANLTHLYPKLAEESSQRNQNSNIGEGTDGEIFLSTNASVIKRFNPEHTISQDIFREYWIGHSLFHPNLVGSHSLSFDDHNQAWVMRMEYVPFALLELLDHDGWSERRWSLEATTCFFRQLVEAVAHMHSKGVAHRDLKVENVMVTDDGVVKLIDFGSAAPSRDLFVSDATCPANTSRRKELGNKILSTENWIGTPITMAPEAHYEHFYDMEAADVWSLGIIFVRLYLGIYPWEPEPRLGSLATDDAFREYLREREEDIPCGGGALNNDPTFNSDSDTLLCQIPEPARAVIAEMLEVESSQRIAVERVLDSEWLRELP